MKHTNWFRNLTIGAIVLWLSVFVFFPHLIVFILSLMAHDTQNLVRPSFSLNNYIQLLDPIYWRILMHSLYMAAMATIVCLLIGYPFAYMLVKMPKKKRLVLLFLIILPFWTNSLIRIYALKTLLSFNGLLNQCLLSLHLIDKPLTLMYTKFAVILGLVYLLLPFMIFPLYSSIEKLNGQLLEAAQDLGAGFFARFLKVVIPQTAPGIVSGVLLVFLPALSLFFISDLLGGAKNLMIGSIIKHQFLNTRDWPAGAATSIMLTAIMILLLYCYFKTNHTSSKVK